MATIIKVGDKYRAQIRRKGITRSATFPKKGLAEAWARQIEADIEAQRAGRLPDRMLTDLFERYILKVSPKKRTGGKEELRIRKFMGDSEFTGVPLKSVSPRIFTAWHDRRLKEVSAGSVLRDEPLDTWVYAYAAAYHPGLKLELKMPEDLDEAHQIIISRPCKIHLFAPANLGAPDFPTADTAASTI